MTPSPKPTLHTLRKRNEFVSMRSGTRQHSTSFVLQMRERDANAIAGSTGDTIRVGYTVTKKIGNAVECNRIKRRMREAAHLTLPTGGRPAHDYVMIGKRAALNNKFEAIVAELGSSLTRVHRHGTKTGIQNGK